MHHMTHAHSHDTNTHTHMMQGGIFISLKLVMGGGTLWPSTMIRNISRIFWRSLSGMKRYFRGGFQPVAMLLVYTVPWKTEMCVCYHPVAMLLVYTVPWKTEMCVLSPSGHALSIHRALEKKACACMCVCVCVRARASVICVLALK